MEMLPANVLGMSHLDLGGPWHYVDRPAHNRWGDSVFEREETINMARGKMGSIIDATEESTLIESH